MEMTNFAVGARDCCHAPAHHRAAANPQRGLLGACAALFLASAAGTIAWGRAMAMDDMPMAGGWTMSMAWMRMPDQSWLGATASFLGMWTLMMVAMMTPSLLPMLGRRQRRGRESGGRAGVLGVVVGAGYFFVWAAQGALVFPLGVTMASAAMRWPAVARLVPLGTGLAMLAAGALQLSSWKARHLACCRTLDPPPRTGARAAWRYGLRLGLHCGGCCAGLTATLLVLGVMDLAVMAAVTVAITAERWVPEGAWVARAVGAVMVAGAALLIVRSAWSG